MPHGPVPGRGPVVEDHCLIAQYCTLPYSMAISSVKHYKTQRKCIKGRADLPNFLPATAKGSDDVTSFKGWTLEHSITSVEVFS